MSIRYGPNKKEGGKKRGTTIFSLNIKYFRIHFFFFLANPLPWSDVNHVISSAMTDLLSTGTYGDQVTCYEFLYHVSFTKKDNLIWLITWLSLGLAVFAAIIGVTVAIICNKRATYQPNPPEPVMQQQKGKNHKRKHSN